MLVIRLTPEGFRAKIMTPAWTRVCIGTWACFQVVQRPCYRGHKWATLIEEATMCLSFTSWESSQPFKGSHERYWTCCCRQILLCTRQTLRRIICPYTGLLSHRWASDPRIRIHQLTKSGGVFGACGTALSPDGSRHVHAIIRIKVQHSRCWECIRSNKKGK